MANSLLDFVMSLVRDPDAAARYAADPARAIADAHLTDVTDADVNNLIPMVSDSLSYLLPTDPASLADQANVWTSGAAAAALDAFTPHEPSVTSQHISPAGVIADPVPAGGWDTPAAPAPPVFESHDPAALLSELPGVPDNPDADADLVVDDAGAWAHHVIDPHIGDADHPGPAALGLDGLI